MTINPNDTVNGTMIFALSDELAAMMGEDPQQATTPENLELPSGVEYAVKPYEDEDFVGNTITFSDMPLEQFNDEKGDDGLRIVRDGDLYRLTGVMDLSDDGEMRELTAAMASKAALRLRFTFPGEVKDSNGKIEGNTVTFTPRIGVSNELNAVAEAKANRLPLLLGVGAGVLALAAVAFVLVLAQRRRAVPASPYPAAPALDAHLSHEPQFTSTQATYGTQPEPGDSTLGSRHSRGS